MLAEKASTVLAVDISPEAIDYCLSEFEGRDNLTYENLVKTWLNEGLPYDDNSFDCVISFHVIEHIYPEKIFDYLREIKRVLVNKGFFLISTPNKTGRLLPFLGPWNLYHIREYNPKELKYLLNRLGDFHQVKLYGLYGTAEIQAIERERLKLEKVNQLQSLLRGKCSLLWLNTKRAWKVIKIALPPVAQRIRRKVAPPTPFFDTNESFFNRISLKDFSVESEDARGLNDCIHCIAVCVK